MAARTFIAAIGDVEKEITVEPTEGGRWRVVIDGVERVLEARRADHGPWTLVHEGRVWNVDVDPGKQAGDLVVEIGGTQAAVKLVDPRARRLQAAQAAARAAKQAAGPEAICAPMPGKVVKVLVKPGDHVTAGQGVAVIEAMKMENELKAPRDATVQAVHVTEGAAVEGQQPVVTLA